MSGWGLSLGPSFPLFSCLICKKSLLVSLESAKQAARNRRNFRSLAATGESKRLADNHTCCRFKRWGNLARVVFARATILGHLRLPLLLRLGQWRRRCGVLLGDLGWWGWARAMMALKLEYTGFLLQRLFRIFERGSLMVLAALTGDATTWDWVLPLLRFQRWKG